MKWSDYFSLRGATENKRVTVRELELPNLAEMHNFYSDQATLFPKCPCFTQTLQTTYTTPPCTIGVSFQWWVNLGAYIVALAAETTGEEIYWSAPYRPGIWTATETVGTPPDDIEVRTGAGSAELAEPGDITQGVNIGGLAVIARGYASNYPEIGFLATTNQFLNPIAYNKITQHITAGTVMQSVDGEAWFIGTDGNFFKCDGTNIEAASSVFDMKLIDASFPSTNSFFGSAFNAAESTFVFGNSTTNTKVYVNPSNGAYGVSNSTDTSRYISTGRLPLLPIDRKVHIQAVKVGIMATTATTNDNAKCYVKGCYDTSWITSPDTPTLATGYQEVTFWVDQHLDEPQLKLSMSGVSSGYFDGFAVLFDDGGPRQ